MREVKLEFELLLLNSWFTVGTGSAAVALRGVRPAIMLWLRRCPGESKRSAVAMLAGLIPRLWSGAESGAAFDAGVWFVGTNPGGNGLLEEF